MSVHQTSLSCGCNVDYSGQRCQLHTAVAVGPSATGANALLPSAEQPTAPFLSPCCNDEPLGYEVRGVYDGVLFWLCQACGSAWVRRGWVGDRKWMAQAFVDAINASKRLTDA